jgi:hypothetical protein
VKHGRRLGLHSLDGEGQAVNPIRAALGHGQSIGSGWPQSSPNCELPRRFASAKVPRGAG